ncbi:hypothetical protein ABPG75_000133 [Micractinium tetrahymenae]
MGHQELEADEFAAAVLLRARVPPDALGEALQAFSSHWVEHMDAHFASFMRTAVALSAATAADSKGEGTSEAVSALPIGEALAVLRALASTHPPCAARLARLRQLAGRPDMLLRSTAPVVSPGSWGGNGLTPAEHVAELMAAAQATDELLAARKTAGKPLVAAQAIDEPSSAAQAAEELMAAVQAAEELMAAAQAAAEEELAAAQAAKEETRFDSTLGAVIHHVRWASP